MHTPGPWHVNDEFSRAHARYDEGTRVVCSGEGSIAICWPICETTRGWDDSRTSPANAQLIAAAPDLLAALEQIIDDMGADGLSCCQQAKNMALDAYEKATGRRDTVKL